MQTVTVTVAGSSEKDVGHLREVAGSIYPSNACMQAVTGMQAVAGRQ